MKRLLLLTICALMVLPAFARPVIYYCYIYTRLPGAEESPVFRFEVDGDQASLTYTYRVRPTDKPQDRHTELDVLNNSDRSLVLGFLTEGDQERAPRYDVWVLDKQNMLLSAETTRTTDANPGRLEQRSGACIVKN